MPVCDHLHAPLIGAFYKMARWIFVYRQKHLLSGVLLCAGSAIAGP